MPHNPLGPICAAATIHLAASVPNFAWMEVVPALVQGQPVSPDLFPVQHKLEGTRFPVPASPGLGVEVDEELAAHGEFRFWEPGWRLRRDGSYQNR